MIADQPDSSMNDANFATESPPRILALFGAAIFFGQERANMEALAALQNEGCDVLCLVRDDRGNTLIPAELDRYKLRWQRVKYIENWRPGRRLQFFYRNPFLFIGANLQLLRIARRYKPTHIYAFNPYFVLNFLMALSVIKTPLIYYSGDTPPLHNIFWRKAWDFVRHRTGKFIAVSHYIEQQLLKTGIPGNRILVIYCGPPARPPLRDEDLSDVVRQPGYIHFEYHGQIIAGKGVHILVEAFRQLLLSGVKAKLAIAGLFPGFHPSFAEDLKSQVDGDDDLRDNVRFLGFVNDVDGLLQRSDVHIAPSICGEALGLVVMEAKQAGRPSIVFPSGGLPEMVSHDRDGYVCPKPTAESLLRAMRHYVEKPELVDIQGEAARESLSRFDLDRFAARWRSEVETLRC